jgi:hypothetical protein
MVVPVPIFYAAATRLSAFSVLRFCFEEQVFITKRSLAAQNAIVRTCPERQVMTMDCTLGCTEHFNFVEFLFQTCRRAGRFRRIDSTLSKQRQCCQRVLVIRSLDCYHIAMGGRIM